MNIKYLKALKEAKVYPDEMTRGMPHIFEDMVGDKAQRCMPYYAYPIPSVSQLCELISNYSKIKIEAEMTDMGTMGYTITVWVTIQDTVEKTFFSPFLDDALAEALLTLKKNSDEKQKMMDAERVVAGHPLE